MRTLLRGFLAGIGFVAGATITGGLIGYGVGKLAEGAIKRVQPMDNTHCEHYHVDHDHLPDLWWCCKEGTCFHGPSRHEV